MKGDSYGANVKLKKTYQHQEKTETWIQSQDENTLRKNYFEKKKSQRQKEIGSLIKRYSFENSERLKKKKEIAVVLNEGIRLNGSMMFLFYLSDKVRKICFIISKKVSKKATVRNKIKRRLREIYRINKNLLPDNIHLAVVAKKGIVGKSFEKISCDAKTLFDKVSN